MSGKKKRKVVIKKRFFVICFLILVIVIFLMVMGIRSVVLLISGNDKAEEASSKSVAKVEVEVNNEKTDSDETKSSDTDTQNEIDLNNSEVSVVAFKGNPSEDSVEYEINNAVLSSWFISPLGQMRSTVDETFGTVSRSEEWGKTIYYHRNFVDTMYVTYRGNLKGDNSPAEDAVCDSVSIALKMVIEFKKFTPNKEFWGEIHEDEGEYSEGKYYLVLIRDDIVLKVYCDQQGRVSEESHIVVSKS